MSPRKYKTKRLFYNKWPYKIECLQQGSSSVMRCGIPAALEWCKGSNSFSGAFKNCNRAEITAFIAAISQFITKDVKIRTEGRHFNIFVKDTALFKEILGIMKPWIMAVTEPGSQEEYNFLVSNKTRKTLCDEIPKGLFKYRIYIRSRMKPDARQSFYNWTQRYEDKFDLAGSTTKWLTGDRPYIQDPFIYVKDDKILSMVGLFLGDNIKIIEEFIPRTQINT